LGVVEREAADLLDLEVVERWQQGAAVVPKPGLHLCPRIPFCLGGSIERNDDAYLCDAIDDMLFKGQLASQLKHVRPGEKVELRAINLPKEQRQVGVGGTGTADCADFAL
jgi:hypothetical protein